MMKNMIDCLMGGISYWAIGHGLTVGEVNICDDEDNDNDNDDNDDEDDGQDNGRGAEGRRRCDNDVDGDEEDVDLSAGSRLLCVHYKLWSAQLFHPYLCKVDNSNYEDCDYH